MAGWTTYGKLDKFCLLPIQSVGLSVTTFVGQNLGAGNMNRAKKGTTTALIIAIGTAIILMFPVLLFALTRFMPMHCAVQETPPRQWSL